MLVFNMGICKCGCLMKWICWIVKIVVIWNNLHGCGHCGLYWFDRVWRGQLNYSMIDLFCHIYYCARDDFKDTVNVDCEKEWHNTLWLSKHTLANLYGGYVASGFIFKRMIISLGHCRPCLCWLCRLCLLLPRWHQPTLEYYSDRSGSFCLQQSQMIMQHLRLSVQTHCCVAGVCICATIELKLTTLQWKVNMNGLCAYKWPFFFVRSDRSRSIWIQSEAM